MPRQKLKTKLAVKQYFTFSNDSLFCYYKRIQLNLYITVIK